MFFLTNGIFDKLYNKTVVEKAISKNKSSICINQPLPLVEVKNIFPLIDHLMLILYDGQSERECLIENEILSSMILLKDKYKKQNGELTNKNFKLEPGSVIQFDTFNYCKRNQFKKQNNKYFVSDEFIINLKNVFFIGKNDVYEKLGDAEASQCEEKEKSSFCRLKETNRDKNGLNKFGVHNIASLKKNLTLANGK